ncbi:hypothetical protein M0804_011411 [Polistes exclamans]|nr:hypothetical protein M0804_011411 [Polistes exclamans]
MAESAASPGSVQVAANSPQQQQQQQQQQQTQQPPDISSSQLASPPITGTGKVIRRRILLNKKLTFLDNLMVLEKKYSDQIRSKEIVLQDPVDRIYLQVLTLVKGITFQYKVQLGFQKNRVGDLISRATSQIVEQTYPMCCIKIHKCVYASVSVYGTRAVVVVGGDGDGGVGRV